ncbi:MAG TPA: phosphatidylserine/phosphatidylglycerophosphate/cardiolipin synthase family protein [Archangium sp.]|uniref:phospholipase D-like domain-containing protein n=1 Tax=Archangium sp. TaxID=1872627 RepID=UPI002E30A099|nr:phosphatidylserine/phosphatidylglycerophosphate/cardiolipin synthase family protein [Archangium sp.]HEX5744954.1 phosphatidylserine/phosphatidylglycerophosphate/cardiolipin synthase family protein [Archangium sp.]
MNRLPRVLLACLLGTACVHRDYPQALRVYDDVADSGPELSLALYQSVGVGLRTGHVVELVQDARILERLEAEIREARESIHLLASNWQPGEASERLLRALSGRQPGVVCRILVDSLHSPGFQDTVEPRLVQAGCDVRAFRPFVGSEVVFNDERLEARNHRQLVIRDGRSGLTGGSGVGPEWRTGQTPVNAWRDTYVHVEGPAVRQLQQAFARDWLEAGGGLLPESAFPTLEPRGEARAGFVASTGSPSLSHSERMVQVLMAAARRRLWLTNACFVPTAATVDTLIRKARAGVDVRILVPGDEATSGVLAAQRASYERLLESGVRLWEYQSAPLYARTLVVDDQLTAVGSNNLEPNASAMLEEGALVVEDAPLARALADSFERDLSHAVEVRKEEWRERGWLDRVGSPLPPSATGCR